jgi:hypothetical protein
MGIEGLRHTPRKDVEKYNRMRWWLEHDLGVCLTSIAIYIPEDRSGG